jgi:hypothetical protein
MFNGSLYHHGSFLMDYRSEKRLIRFEMISFVHLNGAVNTLNQPEE